MTTAARLVGKWETSTTNTNHAMRWWTQKNSVAEFKNRRIAKMVAPTVMVMQMKAKSLYFLLQWDDIPDDVNFNSVIWIYNLKNKRDIIRYFLHVGTWHCHWLNILKNNQLSELFSLLFINLFIIMRHDLLAGSDRIWCLWLANYCASELTANFYRNFIQMDPLSINYIFPFKRTLHKILYETHFAKKFSHVLSAIFHRLTLE